MLGIPSTGYAADVLMVLFHFADALKQRKGTDGDLAGILDLYFHTDHPEKILFAGPALNHWITEDFGRTYTKVWFSSCAVSTVPGSDSARVRSCASLLASSQDLRLCKRPSRSLHTPSACRLTRLGALWDSGTNSRSTQTGQTGSWQRCGGVCARSGMLAPTHGVRTTYL